jgi:hypothetical protein
MTFKDKEYAQEVWKPDKISLHLYQVIPITF